MNTCTATRLRAAEASVTVMSHSDAVTDWVRRYFGPWWSAEHVPAQQDSPSPVVRADIDPAYYADLAATVADHLGEETIYARAPMLVTRHDGEGTVTAVSPEHRLAYYSEPGRMCLTIAGCDTQAVAMAACRLARDTVRGALLRGGWALLHGSAVVHDGGAVLTFGAKGAGKTTTALLLATRGWELLANDRIFVRPDPTTGQVRILPWPSAAALGLGLLDALGLYDSAHQRVLAGEALHPTQDQRVTDALLAGRREPLWEASGRELKAQVFPDQFASWFGLNLATGGNATALIFPSIAPDAAPAIVDAARTLGDHDFMRGATEDRYPDVFGLAGGVDGGGRAEARSAVAEQLAPLPHHCVVLGHRAAANADFLVKLVSAGGATRRAARAPS
ncbi:hypothetical protein [Streptomyces sp. SAJ15]|uniref:hypothetical protein n=1 Tax=Streptomyces sp. SAJ15 TaxID=2011095 RepID=UPI001184D600|nr:hypothetical protein [Streptomyces sp. SAJ15]TVL89001.1 hypothetical protein CD790_29545 [Streptomyces sp. SAJ15]